MATARKKRPMMTLNITQSLSLTSNSTRIFPWLVLAGCEATTDRTTLDQLGASFVLNASSEIKSWFEDDEKFKYLRVPIEDEPTCDVRAYFPAAHAFCEDVRTRHLAGERVGLVVHCKTGMSRSSTMLLSHLMQARGVRRQVALITNRDDCLGAGCATCRALEAAGGPAAAEAACANHGMTLRDALSFIRERRPRASPNAGFMTQLVELEGQLSGGAVTIDLEKYRLDRFGDVRTFCIGEIDPLVGYTGTPATAGLSSSGCETSSTATPLPSLDESALASDGRTLPGTPGFAVTSEAASAAAPPAALPALDLTSALQQQRPPDHLGDGVAAGGPPRRRLSTSQPAGGPLGTPPTPSRAPSIRAVRAFGADTEAEIDASGAFPKQRRPSRLNSLDNTAAAAAAAAATLEDSRAMHLSPSTQLPALQEPRRRPSLVQSEAAVGLGAGARRPSASSTSGRSLLQPLSGAPSRSPLDSLGGSGDLSAGHFRGGVLPGLQPSQEDGKASEGKMSDSASGSQ